MGNLYRRSDNSMNKEEYYISDLFGFSDWDTMMKIWPNCPVDGCKNKIN